MVTDVPQLCECDGFDCRKFVNLPSADIIQFIRLGYYIIVDGCPVGPKETDILVEKREGYSVYRELLS